MLPGPCRSHCRPLRSQSLPPWQPAWPLGPAARTLCAVLWLVVASASALAQEPEPDDDVAATGAALVTHVEVLAADAMLGRETGTEQALAAADYIAGVFEAAGLVPAGEDGGWFQTLPVQGWQLSAPPTLWLQSDATTPAVGQEYGSGWQLLRGGVSVADAPLVRVTEAAGLGALAAGGEKRAVFLDLRPREAFAAMDEQAEPLAQGAALVLVAGREAAGTTRAPPDHLVVAPDEFPVIMVHGAALAALRAATADVAVGARVSLQVETTAPVRAVNVLGLLPGAGTPDEPGLADEVVVFTAHYDHIGSIEPSDAEAAPPASGTDGASGADGTDGTDGAGPDLVYNGANDDASGVAFVLELARAFARARDAGDPPARSLLFMACAGEEQGLLGSQHFVTRPTLPLELIVADLNFEMTGKPDRALPGAGDLFLTGYGRTNLGPLWAAAGLRILDDPYPQNHFYERSDNASFVAHGIVGQTLSSGGSDEQYHELGDHVELLDVSHMAAAFSACLTASRSLADGSVDPAFVEPALEASGAHDAQDAQDAAGTDPPGDGAGR